MSKRQAEDELERLAHLVANTRATLDALDINIRAARQHRTGIGHEPVQALITEVGRISWCVAHHDAYLRSK